MRTLLVAALTVTSGCSFLVQDHLPGEYSGNSEPMCETGNGPAVVDTVFAILNASGVVAVAIAGDGQGKSDAIAGGMLDVALFTASAIAGYSWSSECRDARAHWDDVAEEQRKHDEAKAREEQRRPARPSAPAAQPRGFYCASSPTQPTVGLCVRDKADCVRARDALAAAVADVGECTLQESAWCLGNRCTPNEAACETRRAGIGSDVLECDEER